MILNLCSRIPPHRGFISNISPDFVSSWNFTFSSYPSKRCETDDDGFEVGVMGSLKKLQNVTLSTQPIASFDWSADKVFYSIHYFIRFWYVYSLIHQALRTSSICFFCRKDWACAHHLIKPLRTSSVCFFVGRIGCVHII